MHKPILNLIDTTKALENDPIFHDFAGCDLEIWESEEEIITSCGFQKRLFVYSSEIIKSKIYPACQFESDGKILYKVENCTGLVLVDSVIFKKIAE